MELTDHIKKIVESNYNLAEKQKNYAKNLIKAVKKRKKVVKSYNDLAKKEKTFLKEDFKCAEMYYDLQSYKIALKNKGILHFPADQTNFKKEYATYRINLCKKRLEINEIYVKFAELEEKLIDSYKHLIDLKKEEAKFSKDVAEKENYCSKLTKKCVNTKDFSEKKIQKLKNKIKSCESELEGNEMKLKQKRMEIVNYEKEISNLEENLSVLMKALSYKYSEGEKIRPPID